MLRSEGRPSARKLREGQRIAGIEASRGFVLLDRGAEVSFVAARLVELALQKRVVCLEAPTRRAVVLRRHSTACEQLRLERSRNRRSDLVLQREQVLVGPVVALR